jgi:hypothetical protein
VIKTGSADISISADIGRSKIISGSGDITVGNAVDLDCSTGSGDISVARVDGAGARLGSGSGAVSIGEANCPITAKSGSGEVVVKSVRGASLQANSRSPERSGSASSRWPSQSRVSRTSRCGRVRPPATSPSSAPESASAARVIDAPGD